MIFLNVGLETRGSGFSWFGVSMEILYQWCCWDITPKYDGKAFGAKSTAARAGEGGSESDSKYPRSFPIQFPNRISESMLISRM